MTGTAGGIGAALGVDAWVVRFGFVIVSLAGPVGLLLYAVAYIAGGDGRNRRTTPRTRPVTGRHTLGFAALTLGVLGLAGNVGFGLPPGLVFPAVLVVTGSAIVWARLDDRDRSLLARSPATRMTFGRYATLRLIVGGLVLALGLGLFLFRSQVLSSTSSAVFAGVATAAGFALLLGPWLYRLVQQTSVDRRERIRSEERAEMSAHLHDSVLNTLALIQRSDASSEVTALARRQERELRAWMQGRSTDETQQLAAAIEGIVTRVESQHRITVDAVAVGDLGLDERLHNFVGAVQEAVTNAARHAGTDSVSVYVEVQPQEVTAYIRDQGTGFVRSAVPSDRRGISDSIEGRLRRMNGTAELRTSPNEGTEVELHLPLLTSLDRHHHSSKSET